MIDIQQELNEIVCVVHNGNMNDPETIDPRRRIRELNAIPERDRTDEQWDELNELEIRTAPGNRESDRPLDRLPEKRSGSPVHGRRPDRNQGPKNNGPRPDARPDSRPPQEGRADGRPPKRQHRRPKRPPVDGAGNGGVNGSGSPSPVGNGGGSSSPTGNGGPAENGGS